MPAADSPLADVALDPSRTVKLRQINSLRVLYVLEFVSSLGFAIVLPSLWPYVDYLGGSTSMLGWIVTAGSAGSFIGSPIIGRMGDVFGAKRILVWSLLVGVASSILYAVGWAPWVLLVARFVGGFASGRMAICQSYVVLVTSEQERTPAMTTMGGLNVLGIATGPAFGTIFSLVSFRVGPFAINEYTSCGWASVLASVVCVALVVKYFVEVTPQEATRDEVVLPHPHHNHSHQHQRQHQHQHQQEPRNEPEGLDDAADSVHITHVPLLAIPNSPRDSLNGDSSQEPALNMQTQAWAQAQASAHGHGIRRARRLRCCGLNSVALLCLMFQFFGTLAYIVLETLLPPLLDTEYGFGVLENGITWTLAAVVGVIGYVLLQVLAVRGFSDIALFLPAQFIFLLGCFLFAPWPWTLSFVLDASRLPALPFWRFAVGLGAMALGYTQAEAVSSSMFSKAIEDVDEDDRGHAYSHAQAHAHVDADALERGSHNGRDGAAVTADRYSRLLGEDDATAQSTVTDTGSSPDTGSGPRSSGRGYGESMGIILAVQSAACMVGPAAASHFFDSWGRQVFTFCALTMVVMTALAVRYWRLLYRPGSIPEPEPVPGDTAPGVPQAAVTVATPGPDACPDDGDDEGDDEEGLIWSYSQERLVPQGSPGAAGEMPVLSGRARPRRSLEQVHDVL